MNVVDLFSRHSGTCSCAPVILFPVPVTHFRLFLLRGSARFSSLSPLPNSFHFPSPFSGEGVSKSRRWRGEEGVNEVGRRRWRSEERIGEQKKHNWKHSTYYSAYFTYPLSYTINTKYIHSISRTLLFGRNYNHSAIGKVTLPERL